MKSLNISSRFKTNIRLGCLGLDTIGLTNSPEHDFTPVPAPSGNSVAFTSNCAGVHIPCLLHPRNGEVVLLPPTGVQAGHLSWPPDGATIYYKDRSGNGSANIAEIDILHLTRLVFDLRRNLDRDPITAHSETRYSVKLRPLWLCLCVRQDHRPTSACGRI